MHNINNANVNIEANYESNHEIIHEAAQETIPDTENNANVSNQNETTIKPFKDLNLCDNFLFGKVMRDTEILKPTLELILNFKISHIEMVNIEKTIDPSYNSHGIRLDVYADDDQNNRFAVEMQVKNKYNIPKRSRYYHSAMDIDELLKGKNYNNLKTNYVIFICVFDMFDKELHQYNFEHVCSQIPDLKLNDGTKTIILNTEGTANDVHPDLLAFLRYVKSSTDETAAKIDNSFVNKIHDKVKWIKHNGLMEVEYMTLREMLEESKEESKKQIARNMFANGDSLEKISASIIEPIETIREWVLA